MEKGTEKLMDLIANFEERHPIYRSQGRWDWRLYADNPLSGLGFESESEAESSRKEEAESYVFWKILGERVLSVTGSDRYSTKVHYRELLGLLR